MIQAQHYTNEAEMRAAYIARRNRLMKPKLKPANVNKPTDEEHKVYIVSLQGPEWKRDNIRFDHHVKAYHIFCNAVGKSPIRRFIGTRAIDFGMNYSLIMSKTRRKEVCLARHIIIYEIRTVVSPGMSFPEFGKLFRLDHSSAVHAVKRIQNLKDRGEIETIEGTTE